MVLSCPVMLDVCCMQMPCSVLRGLGDVPGASKLWGDYESYGFLSIFRPAVVSASDIYTLREERNTGFEDIHH